MIATHASGSLTATGGEDFLASPNVQGRFTLTVDLNTMQAGDIVELRAYKMAVTGGTARVCYLATYAGDQAISASDPVVAMLPEIANDLTDTNAVRFSLTQRTGTGRAYPWAVLREYEAGGVLRNTAYPGFQFVMAAADLTVTLTRSIDGGAFAAATNAPTAIGTGTKAYAINLSAADLNGSTILFRATAASQPDSFFTIRTIPA